MHVLEPPVPDGDRLLCAGSCNNCYRGVEVNKDLKRVRCSCQNQNRNDPWQVVVDKGVFGVRESLYRCRYSHLTHFLAYLLILCSSKKTYPAHILTGVKPRRR